MMVKCIEPKDLLKTDFKSINKICDQAYTVKLKRTVVVELDDIAREI